ncbi:MAG: Spx/MgsR family RNA polymerase-binding regulatory protein [Bdellovibrionales bacterium]|nr:Spx/MgsR family RNA polymerase-binding regulatory protein [Bdellovibrionales bacterium]
MLKFYHYSGCSTCRRASAFLKKRGIPFKELDIIECPPSKTELKAMLKANNGEIRRLFNTSGEQYRALNMKERLPELSQVEAIELLSHNGKLIRRPFAIDRSLSLLGFKESDWKKAFSS